MQLQTTSPESKFPNEYIGVIFIQIDQHLKKLFKKYKGFPIFWNTVYIEPFILRDAAENYGVPHRVIASNLIIYTKHTVCLENAPPLACCDFDIKLHDAVLVTFVILKCIGVNVQLHCFGVLWIYCTVCCTTNLQQVGAMEFEQFHFQPNLLSVYTILKAGRYCKPKLAYLTARRYDSAIYAVVLCPSVWWTARLSQVDILQNWLNIGSRR